MGPKPPEELTFTERARRAQIVEATVNVLADEGFAAASLTGIARKAGVSKGLILYYFDSKDDLLRQVLFETVGSLAEATLDSLDLDRPAPDVLRALIHASARVGVERRHSRRAVTQIIAHLGEGAQGEPSVKSTDAEPLIAGIEQLFFAGQSAGTFRGDVDTRIMAITYQAAIDAMYRHLDAHPDADPAAYADALADLFTAAVQDRTPPRG